jgi:16S rRNA (guanine527-N7)-methyltransferase
MSVSKTKLSPILPCHSEFITSWKISQQQLERFQELYCLILEGNKQQNLTRIIEPQEFWEKHLWDSLVAVKDWEENLGFDRQQPSKIIDIGTGAGFPGLPLAICYPDWHFTLVDSTRKKVNFIESILPKLSLNNVTVVAARAEEMGRQQPYNRGYDLAVIRAVSDPAACAKYCLPLLKDGGVAILYRGIWQEEDRSKLESTLDKLAGTIEEIKEIFTPLSHSSRNCIYIRKLDREKPFRAGALE